MNYRIKYGNTTIDYFTKTDDAAAKRYAKKRWSDPVTIVNDTTGQILTTDKTPNRQDKLT